MNFQFKGDPIQQGLDRLSDRFAVAVLMYAQTGALKLQNHAKRIAPWTDRTGAARNRLTGYTESHPGKVRIILAHGVDYGVWLELANEQRFAAIDPALRVVAPQIMEGFRGLLDRVK